MKWTDLLPDVLPEVPGCPEFLAEKRLLDAARQFCRDTHAWEEQLMPVYPTSGILRYQLDVPEETEVLSLVYARQKDGDRTVELKPDINVFGLMRFTDDTAPDVALGPIAIKVRLQPSRAATGMPDRIGLDYDQALIHWALASLKAMPQKDWSDPTSVSYHQALYRKSVVDARVRKARGNTERPIRTTPHPF